MGKRRSVSAPLIAAGLIAFLAADLALVYFALRPPSNSSPASSISTPFTLAPQSPVPSATKTATPTPSSTTTPVPTSSSPATATPAPTATATTAAGLQGFATAQVGYRSTAGSCSGPDAVIDLTTDGGKTWTNVNPTNMRVREVQSIVVVDTDHVDLLARYGDDCTLSDVSTYTQGQFWQAYPDRTAQLQN